MDEILPIEGKLRWYAMRNLKRRHAKLPAYKMFENLKVQCFTPMVYRLAVVGSKQVDQEVPFMQDLPFVKDTREHLDAAVESAPKLQRRYKSGVQHIPIIVLIADMERSTKAVEASDNPKFYSLDEATSEMRNRKIRIIGGQLDGYTGILVTTRSSKIKGLLVELPTLLAASIEVEAEHIQSAP